MKGDGGGERKYIHTYIHFSTLGKREGQGDAHILSLLPIYVFVRDNKNFE